MNVLFIASEMAPWAKTGGLGDVTGALAAALGRRGALVRCVLPRYGWIQPVGEGFTPLPSVLSVRLGRRDFHCRVWFKRFAPGAELFLLEHDALYDRASLYGDENGDYRDNDLRFGLLSRGALALARLLRWYPDVVHAHDWQAGLAAWACNREMAGQFRTVLTIHNLGYQGHFDFSSAERLGLDASALRPDGAEFWGRLSMLKAGIVAADHITTVSPRYAREIQTEEHGFGLERLLRSRAGSLSGILNGVDYGEWDPRNDTHIPAQYGLQDLSGKRACKRRLLEEFGLPVDLDAPVVGVVTRLVWQKGLDLLLESTPHWLANERVRLVVLGLGAQSLEDGLRALQRTYPDKVSVRFEKSERLAHLIEAGSDMFCMPSRYEPCGLNQLYSLRYGTVPVVRATGGLDDTVVDVDQHPGHGTGFKFWHWHPQVLGHSLRRAMNLYWNRGAWHEVVRRGMAQDFSWDRSADAYWRVYEHIGATARVRVPGHG
jgi:starch synthase